jgi:hypothetical protein
MGWNVQTADVMTGLCPDMESEFTTLFLELPGSALNVWDDERHEPF